jgi:hypothetical protein
MVVGVGDGAVVVGWGVDDGGPGGAAMANATGAGAVVGGVVGGVVLAGGATTAGSVVSK